jgi:hypothetical protein
LVSKIIVITIIIAVSIVSISSLFSLQEIESVNKFQIYEERVKSIDWNNDATKILPNAGELGDGWKLLWSDGTKEFVEASNPVIFRKTIAGNEILSTSYNYAHTEYGTYQIQIWKGELLSNWVPREAVENIFSQTDAKIEKTIEGLDLIQYCVVAYYDYYGDEMGIKNDLLFSECAKNDYRIRVNLVEGEFNQKSIDALVLLSNYAVGKI